MQTETKRLRAHAVARTEDSAAHTARRGNAAVAFAVASLAAAALLAPAPRALAHDGGARVLLEITGAAPQRIETDGFGDGIRHAAGAATSTAGLELSIDGASRAGRGVLAAAAQGRSLRAASGELGAVAGASAEMSDRFTISFDEPIPERVVLRFDFVATGEPRYEFVDASLSCIGSSMVNYTVTLDSFPGVSQTVGGTRELGVSGLPLVPYELESGAWGDQGFAVELAPGTTQYTGALWMNAGAVVILRSTPAGDGPEAGAEPRLAVRWNGMRPLERLDGTPIDLGYTVSSDSGFNFVRPEDVDFDGTVTAADLARVLIAWGTGPVAEDIDQDGVVTAADMARVLQAWGL